MTGGHLGQVPPGHRSVSARAHTIHNTINDQTPQSSDLSDLLTINCLRCQHGVLRGSNISAKSEDHEAIRSSVVLVAYFVPELCQASREFDL